MAQRMIWKSAVGFPAFEVSEYGDLRRASTGRVIRGFIDPDGYLRYSLRDATGRKHSVGAHQIVLRTFVGPAPSADHQVAHSDGSRVHCHFSNLRWATALENQRDRHAHGTSAAGERNPRAKITEADVLVIRREYRAIKEPKSGRRVDELDRRYGLSRSAIIRIASGAAWPHVPMPGDTDFQRAA